MWQAFVRRLKFWKRYDLKWADGTVFMVRYTLVKNWALARRLPFLPDSIKLHRFTRADEDLHDHPWPFFSIILWRSYDEETLSGPQHRRWLSMRYHPAHYVHKVCVEPGRDAWTLCFTWKREREWGFFIPRPGCPGLYDWVWHNSHHRQTGRAKVTQ